MTRVDLPPWLIVFLTILAVARLTHLVVHDAILDRPRAFVQNRGGDLLGYVVQCVWCSSVWVGAAAAPLVYAWHDRWFTQIPLLALTASYLTGMLEQSSGRTNAETAAAEQDTR